jgi:hypothetical protein
MKYQRLPMRLLAFHLHIQLSRSFSPYPSLYNHGRITSSSVASMMMSTTTSTEQTSLDAKVANRRRRIAVIGGGASGMFAATSAADAIQRYVNGDHASLNDGYDVVVFEGTSRTMSKVRISGGGRVSDALCCFLCTCFGCSAHI